MIEELFDSSLLWDDAGICGKSRHPYATRLCHDSLKILTLEACSFSTHALEVVVR
jgi:hypothetical protein